MSGCGALIPPISPSFDWNLSTSMWALEETGTSEASRHFEGMKLLGMQVHKLGQGKLTLLMLQGAPIGLGLWSTGHPGSGNKGVIPSPSAASNIEHV